MSSRSATPVNIMRRFKSASVLVTGDVMLDEYVWGTVERVSPEAPVPVVKMTRCTNRLGGAANVAANIASLGGGCLTIGQIGDDAAGNDLTTSFKELGLPVRGLVKANKPTIHKVRVIAQNQQLLRVDYGEDCGVGESQHETLLRKLRREIKNHRVLVISDYGKGLVTSDMVTEIIRECLKNNVKVVVDPKVEHFDLYRDVETITPNHHEAGRACDIKIVDRETLLKAGRRLLDITNAASVLITRGADGMSLFRRGKEPIHIPTEAREVFDVSGAGDTVVATMALALASGEDLETAARLANRAAGIVVGKIGVATLTPQELVQSLKRQPLKRGR